MQRSELEAIVDAEGPACVVERLHQYLSEPRRERIEVVLAGRLANVEVALESPYDPRNASAVVRSAEAFGVPAVHVIAASRKILETRGTTRGTHRWVHTRNWRAIDEFVADARERGLLLAGACPGASTTLEQLPVDRPICLVFGNEHDGLAAPLQAACELRFGIQIHGFAESFNVSVAAAISLYSLTSRWRARLGRAGDLPPDELARERARCYLRSVDDRLIRGLFQPPAASRGQ
ncbi:TrmH family RNA methyltransferase [Nannocystaceae bacterium ST9]